MEKINLKYNASKVDEIEKSKGLPIENCVADNTIGNLSLFIQKGYVKEDGTIGCTRNKSIELIDEYLIESDKDELLLDIVEALSNAGFLSRTLEVDKMRKLKATREKQIIEEMAKME